jgi:predicted deacylase
MTEAAVLPRQIVDQLRTERGGIVDFAVKIGRIVPMDEHKVSNNVNSNKKQ